MKYEHNAAFDFQGKLVIITGAAGILGRSFAHALASVGADLALVDLDILAAQELSESIGAEFAVRVGAYDCDVAQQEQVKDLFERIRSDFGTPYGLINNAASKSRDVRAFFTPTDEYDIDVWREVCSVNLDGMFMVAREFGLALREKSAPGVIVQIASIYGVLAPDDRIYEGSNYLGGAINTPAVYSGSKAGVIGLTRHLAAQWAGRNIRVNAVSPGGVGSGQNKVFDERYSARVPMKRMATANEIAGPVLFLLSDSAGYITGQNLIVDGGLSTW